jgi:hypothetical protein
MTEEIITAIALAIAAVVGFFTYKFRMQGQTKNQKFIEKAKRTGHYTVGEYADSKLQLGVEDSNNARMRNKVLHVRYKYRVNHIEYYKKLSFQSIGMVSPDFPIRVTVYYDPRNPKKAVCPEEATKSQQRQSGCLMTILVTVATLFCAFHILNTLLG